MKHIYLSPHLDDAVLSCGSAIHHHAAAGGQALVITLFAGEAGGEAELSPFALMQHDYWGNPPSPMALRRAEDAAALALLGASGLHLDYLDAVYRIDASGQWLYTDVETLLGEVHPAEPMTLDGAEELADRLAGLIPFRDQAVLYAPLGVGHHVDHQIAHTAARRLLGLGYRLAFYEDYPYAERPGALPAALANTGAADWRAEIISVDAADVAAKVAALSYYQTQMPVLFGGAEAMPNRVWTFAATCSKTGLAERIWRPR